jgi:hypothetical protein
MISQNHGLTSWYEEEVTVDFYTYIDRAQVCRHAFGNCEFQVFKGMDIINQCDLCRIAYVWVVRNHFEEFFHLGPSAAGAVILKAMSPDIEKCKVIGFKKIVN